MGKGSPGAFYMVFMLGIWFTKAAVEKGMFLFVLFSKTIPFCLISVMLNFQWKHFTEK